VMSVIFSTLKKRGSIEARMHNLVGRADKKC
jgi:hypothetical protein